MGKSVDPELESDDCEEEQLEELAIESTVAEQLDQLREELQELERLVKLAQQTIDIGSETKLNELKKCLETEFDELKDGRGKLLIFTEHRDTLEYLNKNLKDWGYRTCEIHDNRSSIRCIRYKIRCHAYSPRTTKSGKLVEGQGAAAVNEPRAIATATRVTNKTGLLKAGDGICYPGCPTDSNEVSVKGSSGG